MKKKLTNDEVNALLERLVDEGHLIHHGGHPDQDFPLSYSRSRKPSGKPYPDDASVNAVTVRQAHYQTRRVEA
jgi:hypothetical protein